LREKQNREKKKGKELFGPNPIGIGKKRRKNPAYCFSWLAKRRQRGACAEAHPHPSSLKRRSGPPVSKP